jgi:emfourin
MSILNIEKTGGLANFGGARSRIRSRGQLDTNSLSATELKAVEALFRKPARSASPTSADAFRFRITRSTAAGEETIEVPESDVPLAVAFAVKDELL